MSRPLTTSEAAELLNCSPQTIARHCALGKYPGAFRWSRRWRIPREAFCRLLEDDPEPEPKPEPKFDLSVTAETKSNGQPYSPAEIELRRKCWASM